MNYTKPVVTIYKDMLAVQAQCHHGNYCAPATGAGPC